MLLTDGSVSVKAQTPQNLGAGDKAVCLAEETEELPGAEGKMGDSGIPDTGEDIEGEADGGGTPGTRGEAEGEADDGGTPGTGENVEGEADGGGTPGTEENVEGEASEPGTGEPEEETDEEENQVSDMDAALFGENQTYAAEYPSADFSGGYRFTDITVEPMSYAAKFEALTKYEAEYSRKLSGVRILYTTDAQEAADFFKGVNHVTYSELKAKPSIKEAYLSTGGYTCTDLGDGKGKVTINFQGEDGLNPGTQYWYRFVWYGSGFTADQNRVTAYWFWTAPESFITKAQVSQSNVSVENITVEEIGYLRAKVVWTLKNPDQESLLSNRLLYRKNDEEYAEERKGYSNAYQDENGQTIPDKYYAIVDLDKAQNVQVRCETKIGSGETVWQESQELSLTPRDFAAASLQIHEEATTCLFSASMTFSPCYPIDKVGLPLVFYYRKKGDSTYQSKEMVIDSGAGGKAFVELKDLDASSFYEYYVTVAGQEIKGGYSRTAPKQFALNITTYEDSDFPDPVFRRVIKNRIGIEENEQITSDKLEKLTVLECPIDQAGQPIESIEGIGNLKNLVKLDLRGHKITDAKGVSGLAALTMLWLEDNDLTDMPNMSGLTRLKEVNLDGNRIQADRIMEKRLPSGYLFASTWVDRTRYSQRGDIWYKVSSKCYGQNGAHPLLFRVEGIKTRYARPYKMTLSIDGKAVSGSPFTVTGSGGSYEIADIGTVAEGVSCKISAILADVYGDQSVQIEGKTVFMADQPELVPEKTGLSVGSSSVRLRLDNLPETYLPANIEGMELVNGETVITADMSADRFREAGTGFSPAENDGFHLYRKYDGEGNDFWFSGTRVRLEPWFDYDGGLQPGAYTLRIAMKDASLNLEFPRAVNVVGTEMPVLETAELLEKNIQYGAYVYLTLSGKNLNPAKFHPVFYEGGKPITECVEYFADYGGPRYKNAYTYKLKKLEREIYWSGKEDGYGDTHTWRPEADADYQFVDGITDKKLYISCNTNFSGSGEEGLPYTADPNDFVVDMLYNYREGRLVIYTDGSVPNGTKAEIGCYDWWNGKFATKRAKGQGTFKDDRITVELKDVNTGNRTTVGGSAVAVKLKITWPDGSTSEVKHVGDGSWYDFRVSTDGGDGHYGADDSVDSLPAGAKKWEISFARYQYRGGSTFRLVDKDGKQRGKTITLKKESKRGYVYLTGMWTDEQGLEPGDYGLYDFGADYAYLQLHVYEDNKFWMDDQRVFVRKDETGGRGITVSFTSKQVYGDYVNQYGGRPEDISTEEYWTDQGYQVQIFDRAGNEITGWEKDCVEWTDEAGIPVDPRGNAFYVGSPTVWEWNKCYLSVSLKNFPAEYAGCYVKLTRNGETGIRSDGTACYDSQYGQWHLLRKEIEMKFRRTLYMDSWYDSYVISGFYADMPCYPVRVTISTLDGRQKRQFTADEPVRGQDYVFTAADLEGLAKNECYRIKAEGADGGGVTDKGFIAVESASLHIPSYKLNHTSLSFDLASGTEQSETLQIRDGATIVSAVTWSSTDESVATVSKGVVTPTGAGTAKILAAVKNGPTRVCEVTVTRDELRTVRISESACTLYVNSDGEQVLDDDGKPMKQMPNEQKLRLYLTPNDTTGVGGVSWESDNKTVADVEVTAENTMLAVVTAKGKGNARITVSVTAKSGETLVASCQVTVKSVTGKADIPQEKSLEALQMRLEPVLTNEQLTLADVVFPSGFEGWEWRYPDVSLKTFSGIHEKAFAVQYRDPADQDAEPYKTSVTVCLHTVTGISIVGDGSMHKGDTATASVLWNIDGIPLGADEKPDMSRYADKVSWSSDKPAVVSVAGTGGNSTTLRAEGKGSATVRAQAVFRDGKTYKAQYKVTVTEGDIADISVISVDHFTREAAGEGGYDIYRGGVESGIGSMKVTLANAARLTAKSSNPKVVAVVKTSAEKSDGSSPVDYNVSFSVKAAGMAVITLTANDTAKTKKEIWLYVEDSTPNISEDTLTVNLKQTTGTPFFLYPNEGFQVADAAIDGEDASKFTLEKGSGQGAYVIRVKEGIKKGTYKLSLKGRTERQGTEYNYENLPFKVKVVDQGPKYRLKQDTKINLFYTNPQAYLSVSTEETITDMELTGCDFISEFSATAADGCVLRPQKNGLTSDCSKKGVLKITFAGWQPVTVNYTVAVEKKAPKLSLASGTVTLYPEIGMDSADVILKSGKTDYTPSGNLMAKLDDNAEQAGVKLAEEQGKFVVSGSGMAVKKTVKAKITFTEDDWVEPITLTCTVKTVSGKPALKLGKTILQLNEQEEIYNYETAATEVTWKNGAQFKPLGMSVSGADAKARDIINSGIVFTCDCADGLVTARLNSDDVAKGSYRFKVNVRVTDDLTVTAAFTVKVVKVAKEKAVRLSTKGSIDILNRSGTCVTVTPKLQSLNGGVVDVHLSGRAAHLFHAVCDNGKVVIYARQDAALITKYAYKMKLNLTVENAVGGRINYQTEEISLKLKQGRPKISMKPGKMTFFAGGSDEIQAAVQASLKGVDNPKIEKMELINGQNLFTGVYDGATGTFTLKNQQGAIKGKTYSLQFRVFFVGQADNEKPFVVRYSVKVK